VDDARLQGNVCTGQTIGIATAVDALVMVKHPVGLDWHVGRLDDVVAEDRMGLHLFVLLDVELGRLLEDRVGYADLANVVQQPG
jgi:hypothetical protein